MKADLSTGFGQSDLTLRFDHHEGGFKSGFKIKDYQVASAEFIGTFFLTLIIAGSKNNLDPSLVPFGIGFGLIALVYCTGPISGGQLNPAVTIGLVMRNHLNMFEAAYCIVSQFCGAAIAGLICYALYDDNWDSVGYPSVGDNSRRVKAFVGEMLQTFALVTVVLNTATTKAQSNNSYFALAIGFVVLSGAMVIGGVSGACFNPAISILSAMHGDRGDAWVFMAGPTLGGTAAGLLFRITNPSEWDDSDPIAKLTKSHHNPEGNLTRMASMLTQEFIGTFFIAWTIALSGNAADSTGCVAVGAMATSMVYAGGAVSGSHYNPCVTLGVYLRGLKENPQMMRIKDSMLYCMVQIVAAFCGAGMAAYVNGGTEHITAPKVDLTEHTYFAGLIAEMLFSFALVLTVLSVATTEKVSGNSYFGMAIGFTVIAGNVAVGAISGGVFNPAIGIALPAVATQQTKDMWVYVIGDCLGALFGVAMYHFWYEGIPLPVIPRKNSRDTPATLALLGDLER